MNKLKKKIKIKKLVQRKSYPNVCINTPPGLSKKEEREYIREIREEQDKADDILKSYKKDGLKLMNDLFKTISRMEKHNTDISIFITREAEFLMAEWLNEINSCVQYGIISK